MFAPNSWKDFAASGYLETMHGIKREATGSGCTSVVEVCWSDARAGSAQGCVPRIRGLRDEVSTCALHPFLCFRWGTMWNLVFNACHETQAGLPIFEIRKPPLTGCCAFWIIFEWFGFLAKCLELQTLPDDRPPWVLCRTENSRSSWSSADDLRWTDMRKHAGPNQHGGQWKSFDFCHEDHLQETLWEMFHTFSTHRISMTVVFSPWHFWRQTNLADSRSKIWQLAEPTGQPTVKFVKGVEPGCEMHLGWVNPQAWIWDGSFNSTFAIIFDLHLNVQLTLGTGGPPAM